MKTDMKDISIFGATLQLDGTTVFLLITGGIAIWLLMSFLFTSSNEESVEVIVRTENTPLPRETKKPDRKKDKEEAKREALRRKKQRERRKEFVERLLSTLKKAAVLRFIRCDYSYGLLYNAKHAHRVITLLGSLMRPLRLLRRHW